MARNGHGQSIGRTRTGHGAHGLWRSDSARKLGIADGAPHRDPAERPPAALLKGSSSQIERQVEPQAGRLDHADDTGHDPLERGVAADQMRARKAILQIARKPVWIVAEQNGAYPAG